MCIKDSIDSVRCFLSGLFESVMAKNSGARPWEMTQVNPELLKLDVRNRPSSGNQINACDIHDIVEPLRFVMT
ncbi:MAG: hypothetical protein JWL59_2494 [Chthoniobacteraceae bacterium]|nr:hypothetical protein [Chthoniobacteraceae bacterium]